MKHSREELDVERVYEAVDWAAIFLSQSDQSAEERQELLDELFAVRNDLMDALGMLEEAQL